MLFFLAAALAAPVFDADSRQVRQLADELWPVIRTCAGGSDPGLTSVRIDTRLEGASWFRRSTEDPQQANLLIRRAGRDWTAGILVHELAHAWFDDGPEVLTEMRAEAVRLCVAKAGIAGMAMGLDPEDLHPPRHDLRDWSHTRAEAVEREDHGSHEAVLLWMTSMGDQAPPVLELDSWQQVSEYMAAHPHPAMAATLRALEAGATSQAAMMEDPDGDNVPTIREWFEGTDPQVADSDGDGTPDGLEWTTDAHRPLPMDGRPICLAALAPLEPDQPDDERRSKVTVHGRTYAGSTIVTTMSMGPAVAFVRPINPMLRTRALELPPEPYGNDRCRETARGLLTSSASRTRALAASAEHFDKAVAKVEAALGLPLGRRTYRLGGGLMSLKQLAWLEKREAYGSIALQMVISEATQSCNALNSDAFRDVLYDLLGGVAVSRMGFGGKGTTMDEIRFELGQAGSVRDYATSRCSQLTPQNK